MYVVSRRAATAAASGSTTTALRARTAGPGSSVKVVYAGLGVVSTRQYHDESFGYRPPPRYVFPDCEFLYSSNLPCIILVGC